jgi:hypothetical protein
MAQISDVQIKMKITVLAKPPDQKNAEAPSITLKPWVG